MHSGLDEDGQPEEHAGLGKPATLQQRIGISNAVFPAHGQPA